MQLYQSLFFYFKLMESSVILNGLFNKNVNIIFVLWHEDYSPGLLYFNEKLVNYSYFSTETQHFSNMILSL